MAELKTTIQLRADTTANWDANESKTLKPGEVGIEFQENGKTALKIGRKDAEGNDQAWKDLDYFASANPANVYQVELAEGEMDIDGIDRVVAGAELQSGDVAIVKSGIAGSAKSYTSYVYGKDGEGNMVWMATDGNYSAANVYFKNNITLAGDYTAVGNVKLSDSTLETAGQSLEDVMTSIFTKELKTGLKKNNPGASITSTTEYFEIGQPGSVSTTVSLSSDGEYTYGYSTNPTEPTEGQVVTAVKNDKTTGVVVDTSKGNSTYSVTFNGSTQTSSSASFTISAPAQSTKKELTASGKVYHTQGGVPVSNLKKAYPDQRIAAGQVTSGASTKLRWYVPYYKGFIYDKANKMSTVDVSKLTKVTGETAFGANATTAPVKPTSATATGEWMQYWLVVPKSYNWTMTNGKDENNLTLDITTTHSNITINYGTAEAPINVEYNVYYIDNADPYGTLNILWS